MQQVIACSCSCMYANTYICWLCCAPLVFFKIGNSIITPVHLQAKTFNTQNVLSVWSMLNSLRVAICLTFQTILNVFSVFHTEFALIQIWTGKYNLFSSRSSLFDYFSHKPFRQTFFLHSSILSLISRFILRKRGTPIKEF